MAGLGVGKADIGSPLGGACHSSSAPAPLVLIPGICGTQLAVRPKGELGDGDRCWVTVRGGADAAYQKLWAKYSPDSGLLELLRPGYEVCVPQGQDGSGLFAVSVLDPDIGFAIKAVHYFEPFINHLKDRGYMPGVTLFGAGYDFRQSCRVSARALLARLEEIFRRCGGQRLDLVTHSMGGLVVRSLLADHPGEFERLVGRWVAIACPFGGAPGWAVDGLVTGVQFGGSLGDAFFVQRGTFRQAACQSPAVYELLPPLDFPFVQVPPQITLWLKTPLPEEAEGGEPHGPLQCITRASYSVHRPQAPPDSVAVGQLASAQLPRLSLAPGSLNSGSSGSAAGCCNWAHQYVFRHDALPNLLTRLLKDNTVSIGDRSVPLPFARELWALGQQTHETWRHARLPASCPFFNIHGAGLSTPYDVQYGTWYYSVQDIAAVPHSSAAFTYVDGDATVPTESATAHGFQATASISIKGAHRDLVAMQEVWDQVLSWLKAPARGLNSSLGSSCSGGSITPWAMPAMWQPSFATDSSSMSSSSSSNDGMHSRHVRVIQQQRQAQQPHQASCSQAPTDDEFWNPLIWQHLLR